jgi:hypothetical protein
MDERIRRLRARACQLAQGKTSRAIPYPAALLPSAVPGRPRPHRAPVRRRGRGVHRRPRRDGRRQCRGSRAPGAPAGQPVPRDRRRDPRLGFGTAGAAREQSWKGDQLHAGVVAGADALPRRPADPHRQQPHRAQPSRRRPREKEPLRLPLSARTQVAAPFYSLIESAKLVGVDPRAYLLQAVREALATPGSVTLPHALRLTAPLPLSRHRCRAAFWSRVSLLSSRRERGDRPRLGKALIWKSWRGRMVSETV